MCIKMKRQHNATRLFAAALLISYTSYVGASSTNTTLPVLRGHAKRDLSDSTYNRLAIIHASVGSAATMLIFPLGILGARGLRIVTAKWWWAHAALQGVFGLGCIIAAFVLGVILNGPEHHFRAGHRQTGLVLLILVVVQSVFGIAIKLASKTRIQDPNRVPAVKGHPLQNLFHIVAGLATVGLGFWQTWSGFALIEQGSGGNLTTPLVVYVLWGVIVGVVTSLYLAGLGLIPLQLRKEKERREAVQFFDDDKLPRTAMFNGGAVDNSYRSGDSSSAATLRNRFDTWNEGASASALEQEILERKRQTSIAPLIGRRE